ncbi:MAG: helix-turn-helix domain-containing protein [Caldilineaceae bacterium]
MTTVGRESVRQLKHGHILLQADAGQSDSVIAERVGVPVPTVGRIRKRYVTEGLAVASAQQRSGRPYRACARKTNPRRWPVPRRRRGRSVGLAVISRQSR